jgi:Tfp pilus assembly protein FimT
MVMFILSLVTIAALPVNKWLRSQGVKLATEQLRGDLQLARLMAIKHRKSCSIEVNTPSINRYSNSLNHQMVDLAT